MAGCVGGWGVNVGTPGVWLLTACASSADEAAGVAQGSTHWSGPCCLPGLELIQWQSYCWTGDYTLPVLRTSRGIKEITHNVVCPLSEYLGISVNKFEPDLLKSSDSFWWYTWMQIPLLAHSTIPQNIWQYINQCTWLSSITLSYVCSTPRTTLEFRKQLMKKKQLKWFSSFTWYVYLSEFVASLISIRIFNSDILHFSKEKEMNGMKHTFTCGVSNQHPATQNIQLT